MIISIEGLKGAGKSTLANRLSEEFGFKLARKYTKVESAKDYLLPAFISNFFLSLENSKDTDVILEKGLISLSLEGFYGCAKAGEIFAFEQYKRKSENDLLNLIKKYRAFEEDTLFLIVDCSLEERIKRVSARNVKKPSDLFFLDSISCYSELFERNVEIARNYLNKSRFIRCANNSVQDLERIVGCVMNLVKTTQQSMFHSPFP